MALEDIAMVRAVQNSHVLYPSDGISAYRAVDIAYNTPGMFYIRTSRPVVPVLYPQTEEFSLGKMKVVSKDPQDKILVVSGGVILHEVLAASKLLAE